MALIPFDPFRQLSNMQKEFDHFFTDFPSHFGNQHNIGGIRVDVHETENEIIATCDIPGLAKKEDVDIEVENDMLMISGSIHKSQEMREENTHRRERYVGRFQPAVSLPSLVSNVGVRASYKNGVLEVRMPKSMKNQRRRIHVEFH